MDEIISTRQKALDFNLDSRTYGTFAEIGAGQEVAALFFKAGAASGTIAKTMSAYDMVFSDNIYGKEPNGRYVCESRLMKMLDREYSLLIERLDHIRGENTLFFAFANTVVTLNFKKTNHGHGWLGVRFQLHPKSQPNELVVHINLFDNDTSLQQQVIGIIGVNMVHGCMYLAKNDILKFTDALFDNLDRSRVNIDMLRISGPDFHHIDNRRIALYMVKKGYSNVAVFDKNGNIKQPADLLYKKNILVTRGRFRPPTKANADMFRCSFAQFSKDLEVISNGQDVIPLVELTLKNLQTNDGINEKDFLERADILRSLGMDVMISNYHEYYKLVSYLSTITKNKLGIVLGLPNIYDIFNEEYYTDLKGGILESFATLFSRNVKLYVYPSLVGSDLEPHTSKDVVLPSNLKDLYEYLQVNNKIEDINGASKQYLSYFSDDVIKLIHADDQKWESMVPKLVRDAIITKKLFGYKKH
ncbi:MAG: TonB-dependent receptor [Cytophagales bacterium]